MSVGITIVGLGPGGSQHWTRAAYDVLQQAAELYLRTAAHPGVAEIGQTYAFDGLDNPTGQPGRIEQQIAAEIIKLGRRPQGVIYAVPGHPQVGEATVAEIERLARASQLPVTIIPGLSFFEPVLTALGLTGLAHLQLSDALALLDRHHPPLEPDRPALVAHLHSPAIADRLAATLRNAYPADLQVTLIQAAGTNRERLWACSLDNLADQAGLDGLTTLYLPTNGAPSSFSAFQETIAHLRAPEGCPWDRQQTHRSLRPYLLEETYEVLETLDAGDSQALAEELGDLLLQIVLHTQIAIDHNEFNMATVIEQINRKLIRRHPHVFSDVVVNSAGEVKTNWEAIKKEEKAAKGQSEEPASALDGVPEALPALAQALALSQRAVRVGFEWPNIEGVLDKVVEEAHEIAEAQEPDHLESEIGDLLFSVVNLARWQNIDPESALRATNARFSRRFKKIESLAAARGTSLAEMTIEAMDQLWELAKREEGSR